MSIQIYQEIKKLKIIAVLLIVILLSMIADSSITYAASTNLNKKIKPDQLPSDINRPEIIVTSPLSGDVVTESEPTVTFSVSDDSEVKDVSVNGVPLPVSQDGQYTQEVVLQPGENLISITAIDSSDNKSNEEIVVGLLPQDDTESISDEIEDILDEAIEALEEILELTESLIEELEDKVLIDFEEEFVDLNEAFIKEFIGLTEGLDELIDIANTVSIEILNAPEIPEGFLADFELPEFEDFGFFEELEDVFEIPKGFSFATDISFGDFEEPVIIPEEGLADQNTAVLVDSNGKTFVVGFGFFQEVEEESINLRKGLRKNYRFQTESSTPLELTTTITIPADAKEGDAKVSILNKNQSLATILLKVAPPRDVKVGKRIIGKPQINEPINATIKKSGKKTLLHLKIKGKNFVQKIATIDGKLQKLLGKAQFFTNVTFAPSDGIKIKKVKVRKNSLNVIAEIQNDIESGIKLFNVITPKGADIGALVIPDVINPGKLETTAKPEELILENN